MAHADRPAGQRRLILSASGRAVQAVNWITVNNPRKLAGWPDAGGYPSAEFVRSKNPLALVRDLTLRMPRRQGRAEERRQDYRRPGIRLAGR